MSNHSLILSPPDELVDKWTNQSPYINPEGYIATQAAQWGADQELEACCELVPGLTNYLRAARRPKPPSLKKQALHELNDVYNRDKIEDSTYDTIRRALEQL